MKKSVKIIFQLACQHGAGPGGDGSSLPVKLSEADHPAATPQDRKNDMSKHVVFFWQGLKGSNPRPTVLEAEIPEPANHCAAITCGLASIPCPLSCPLRVTTYCIALSNLNTIYCVRIVWSIEPIIILCTGLLHAIVLFI